MMGNNRELFNKEMLKPKNLSNTLARLGGYFGRFWYVIALVLMLITISTWTQVITERRATHAATPARAHPPAGHIGSGIYLAGDHTDPDYPATLEAAVRSGIRAAGAVRERL